MSVNQTLKKGLLLTLLYSSVFYAQEDQFLVIGLEKNKNPRIHYDDFSPSPHSGEILESETSDLTIDFPKIRKITTKEEVNRLVDSLYKVYKPFLADLTKNIEITRDSLELETFKFKVLDSIDFKHFNSSTVSFDSGETVKIPHYTGPAGIWHGLYKKEFKITKEVAKHKRIFLNFGAVDYYCEVYLNGRFIKLHEGFFSPFKIDVTNFINKTGKNSLVIYIKNDSPALGTTNKDGSKIPDGNKIYGATGLGWNEPGYGWHHSPPGAGIWQKVYLEGAPEISISDINVIPNLDKKNIEVEVQIYNPLKEYIPIDLNVSVIPKNFVGQETKEIRIPAKSIGPGFNTIKQKIILKNYKVWDIKTPYLYKLKVKINSLKLKSLDVQTKQFGMRSFSMDTVSPIKGTFYLNEKEIILRGANTMGFMQNDVFVDNKQLLIKDILLAKLANINLLRLTQRPVQSEIYEMCDNLGVLLQTDFPLFAYLQRTKFEEALKQVGEMERLIRSHPSNIMVSLINEPVSPSQRGSQRFLSKNELDKFFIASTSVINYYNPKQVIKYADGDRTPPSRGYPDKHLYNTWYGNHGISIGKFIKGFWIGNKEGWRHGCGEYGSEALESLETMFKYYPKKWLPEDESDTAWTPNAIPKAQTWKIHQLWYETPKTAKEWVEASQEHQSWSVETQTRAFRRQTQRINSTVVHHLTDAWPAGWMKALIDFDRSPKKAYFKLKEALEPLIVDIRTDKLHYFAGDSLKLEFWVNNDASAPFNKGSIIYEVSDGEKVVFKQKDITEIPSFSSKFIGHFNYKTNSSNKRAVFKVRLGLEDNVGRLINDYEVELEIFPSKQQTSKIEIAGIIGNEKGKAWHLAENLGLNPVVFDKEDEFKVILVEDLLQYDKLREEIYKAVGQGAKLVFLEQSSNSKIIFKDDIFQVNKSSQSLNFLSINREKELFRFFKKNDFKLWYNPSLDRIDFIANSYILGDNLSPILTTGQWDWSFKEKIDLPVFAKLKTNSRDNVYFCQLVTNNGVKEQPVLYSFLNKVILED